MRKRPGKPSRPEPEELRKGVAEDAEAEEIFNQRATFYFSENQLLSLEVVMLKLRTEQRLKVGKSEIMRAALDFVLEDYNQNKEWGWLVRRLTGKA